MLTHALKKLTQCVNALKNNILTALVVMCLIILHCKTSCPLSDAVN